MFRFLALFALIFMPALAAQADETRPVLVELFASQNCAACPKAHKTMAEITAERDDVLVLTWSVDYWDYLGEPDPMALEEAKTRQEIYAENLGLRAPYTPQSIYDGVKQCPGPRKSAVRRNIKDRLKADRTKAPVLRLADGGYRVEGNVEEALEMTLVKFLDGAANTTDMINPVVSTRELGLWTGSAETVNASCEEACAVLLHRQNYGEVVSVLRLN